MKLSPVQVQQGFNLFLLLIAGMSLSLVYLSWTSMITLLIFVIIFEHSMLYIKDESVTFFSYSSLVTTMGVMLMLVTPHLYIYLLVIALGLLQKHFLTLGGRHFFNPSNFALLCALVFFYDNAHIVLGQLGDGVWLKVLVLLIATAILMRVSRWVIPLVFVISYLCMQYVFIVQNDPVVIMDDIYHRFYSVSFIVFILFMLTDPRTTPNSVLSQVGFTMIIILISTWLDYHYGFRIQHLFMALFLSSIIVPLYVAWEEKKNVPYLLLTTGVLLLLALSAIIYIEMQPPYYFEMD